MQMALLIKLGAHLSERLFSKCKAFVLAQFEVLSDSDVLLKTSLEIMHCHSQADKCRRVTCVHQLQYTNTNTAYMY